MTKLEPFDTTVRPSAAGQLTGVADAPVVLVAVEAVALDRVAFEEAEATETVCDPEMVLVLSVVVDTDAVAEEDTASLAPQTPLFATEAPRVDFM